MNWFALIWGIITSPLATLTALAEARPWRAGLVYFLLTCLAGGLVTLLRPSAQRTAVVSDNALFNSPVFILGGTLVGGLIVLLISTGLLYQVGLRQGGDGYFVCLLTAMLFGQATVGLVTLLLDAAFYLLLRGAGGTLASGSLTPALALGLWSLAMSAYALRASLRLSAENALATVVYTILVGLLIGVIGFWVFGAFLSALP